MNIRFDIMIALSLSIQVLGAFLALRLIKITKTRTAWILISVALLLMALRRLIILFYPDIYVSEIIGLFNSALLLMGVAKIGPLFLTIRRSEEQLQSAQEALLQAHNQLEQKVKERTLELEVTNDKLVKEIYQHKVTSEELRESILKLKQTQEALLIKDKLALVGQMAAGMAHEIKNPLTSVRGLTQIISEKIKHDKDLSNYTSIIIQEVDKATSVISDFLNLARPKPNQSVKIPLDKIIRDTHNLVGPQAYLNKINIECNGIDDHLYSFVDENQIKQVLFNLCKNGIDSMPNGGTLKINAGLYNDEVFIEVEDTGYGISEDQLKEIFVPFYTTKDNGTGLGLSICYTLLQANNGRIDVSSREGVGTKFRIFLPCSAA